MVLSILFAANARDEDSRARLKPERRPRSIGWKDLETYAVWSIRRYSGVGARRGSHVWGVCARRNGPLGAPCRWNRSRPACAPARDKKGIRHCVVFGRDGIGRG